MAALLATLLVTLTLLAGCGGDEAADDAELPSGASAGAAGVYDTSVALLNSTCEGIDVQDDTTTVKQGSASTKIELTHAGTTYPATLAADGQFTSDPVEVMVGVQTHSLVVHGSFSDQGFRASVLATVTGGAAGPCGYEVAWVGTRRQ